jgi:hypothetical protein
MKNRLAAIGLAVLCSNVAMHDVARSAPLDSLLAAIAAEESAPTERVRLFMKRGEIADTYYIDRIRPDRLRVLKNPRQGGMEMIVIENKQWLRTGAGGWQAGAVPAAVMAQAQPSLSAMLKNGLTNASERDEANGRRVIEGDISWSAATSCKGKLQVTVERSGRPSFLTFEGDCASKPTVFRQAFSYEGGFAIEPHN